jgi:enoyl-[acyl-carrier-protein] reductase (NADH)
MTITWAQFIWGFGLLVGWTGLLLGAIKYLLNRQISAFETKVAEADKKASSALAALTAQDQAVTKSLADLRLEISNKLVCGNHARMETDNTRQWGSLDKLNGKIEKMDGKLDGIINSIDLLMQHHITGGK